MDRGEDDDIRTPSTSRSSSVNELEEGSSSVLPSPSPIAETTHPETFSPNDTSTDATEQTTTIKAPKRNSFVSSNSATPSSESETDFVAVDKKDLDSGGSTSLHAVSLLTG